MVFCKKFQKEMPGLDAPPWPGELGQRIYDNISAEAWKLWEERMKMILNEYRLMPWQKEAQEIVQKQMEEFFFGEGAALPSRVRSPAGQVIVQPARTAIGAAISKRSCACASVSALTTDGEVAPRAKMNPR